MNKTRFLFAFAILTSLIFSEKYIIAQSRDVQVELTVLGNCGMCKERIERAAFSIRGVRSADWNKNTKKLTLSYRSDRTSQETVERAIAKAGHDTENFLADEKTHANLHHCCVYERNPEFLRKNKLWNAQ